MSYNFLHVHDAKVALTIAKTLRAEAKKWEKHAHKITNKPTPDFDRIAENKRLIQAVKYCIKKSVDNDNLEPEAVRFEVPLGRLKANMDSERAKAKRIKRQNHLKRIYGLRQNGKTIREIARITKTAQSSVSLILRQRKLREAADRAGLQMTRFAHLWRKNALRPETMEWLVESDIVFR